MDRGGQVAAGQLVFTLGAGFDAGQAVPDRIVDRLVIAAFEMQEGVMLDAAPVAAIQAVVAQHVPGTGDRSEEHTSELQSLMRISYAVFCLKKKKNKTKKKN